MTKATVVLALLIGVVTITVSPVLAQVLPAYFDITSAKVNTNKTSPLELELYTIAASIPVTGEDLLGYGVLTASGDSLIVTTSHGGTLDSILQNSAADPVWHNHFVKLQPDNACPVGLVGQLSVADLTWISPGTIKIDGTEAKLTKIPTGIFELPSGTTLGKTNSIFNTGIPTNQIASFQLSVGPVGQICVDVKDIITASD